MANMLAKYEIIKQLGSGGYADVYLARDTELGREVALKVLHQAHLLDENTLARFKREGQVLAGLVHPHIAFAWEFGQAGGRVYIATRYIAGPSLEKLLAGGKPLPWSQAQQILEQVGAALDFAHRKGIIHRDVKPANILVGEEEGAVLTDFGLVKALHSSGLTTTGKQFMGTPAYIPPETWLGQEATPASDQYSLACVLGEMLSGKALFPGETPPAIMTRHVMSGPALPASWPAGAPAGLAAALRKALSRDPQERFASVKEFVAQTLTPSPSPFQGEGGTPSPLSPVPSPLPAAQAGKPDALGFEWIEIPAGDFLYGDDKTPSYIRKPYLISKYEVTQAQYQGFIDANPEYKPPSDWTNRRHPAGKARHPVVNVSWNDAQAFCRWASDRLGKEVRLPTEQEWEKAARGMDGRTYPWGEEWVDGKYTNSWEAGINGTTPVDDFPLGVSPYGVWDMSGNVFEWTASMYEGGDHRVVRGGSWGNLGRYIRCADRSGSVPVDINDSIGFRLLLFPN